MLIITFRTDKPEAEIGLYDGSKQLTYETWPAHRQLAETLHDKIRTLLNSQKKSLDDLGGILIYKGPGSFTGLRIGVSVANSLAYSMELPILASQDPDWLENGLRNLLAGANETIATPEYGALPNITVQKK